MTAYTKEKNTKNYEIHFKLNKKNKMFAKSNRKLMLDKRLKKSNVTFIATMVAVELVLY